jgi:glycosyltransferase involved in cell wall biosynthesis
MKILSIGTDRKLFEKDSMTFWRQKQYSIKAEMHIIVFSLSKLGLQEVHEDNLHIYPTNSVSKLFYIFDAVRLGKKVVQNSGFVRGSSVISVQDPFETGRVGVVLKKLFNFPLQVQVHTDFLDPHFKNPLLNRVRVIMANFVLPMADGIRVVSLAVAQSIGNKFPKLKDRIDVLPVFVDIQSILDNKEQISGKQWKNNIVMASRFSQEKRIDVALSALQKVIKSDPDAGLTIIGSGEERENLIKTVNKLGLTHHVTFLNWQNNLIPHFKSADIFLLSSEYEGYGIVLIEAGASGVPIVTTKVGIAKTELFKNGENSYVCPVGDIECISKSIIDLLKNPEKRELFKERIQDSIKKIAISQEEYVSRYISLLEKLQHHD